MKRYIIFAISFIILFLAFQVLSGYFMTLFYTPNIEDAWSQAGNSSSSVVIKEGAFINPLFFAFLAATIAYVTPKVFVKDKIK